MNQLINLIYLFLLLWGGLFVMVVFSGEIVEEVEEKEYFYCGTTRMAFGGKDLLEGKNLFWNYCASCHHIGMSMNLIGPKLEDFSKSWNNDTLMILDYIRNSREFIDSTKFIHILKLEEEYSNVESHVFRNMTREELRLLMQYIDVI